jgi:uncharacterized cupin superfamily protein
MTQRRHKHVINVDEVEPQTTTEGARFGFTTRGLGRATDARGIGCSWYEVAPGRAAFPRHWHAANEEALFVLEGEGTLRIGDDQVRVGRGDYVTLPTGPEAAHKLTNTGPGPLRYLCFSTLVPTEIVGYPDSKKIGAAVFDPTSRWAAPPRVRMIVREDAQVGYYEGEDVG